MNLLPHLASLWPAARPPHLVSWLVHSVFTSRHEAQAGEIDPQQAVTLDNLDTLISDHKKSGWNFVHPDDLDHSSSDSRFAWLTFDDGYANNLKVLPLLEHHNVPATFFVTTGNILSGQAFWWDVFYRYTRNLSDSEQDKLRRGLKQLPWPDLLATLRERFGHSAFTPCGDTDRPLSQEELTFLATHPLATVANHCQEHAILPLLPAEEIMAQIQGAQKDLNAFPGAQGNLLAWPNGKANAACFAAAKTAGIRLATSTESRIAHLPLTNPLAVPRFTLEGTIDIALQGRLARNGLLARHRISQALRATR